ncbi:MAG: hypothetical protein E6R03_13355 [Hyphomicrobiaceae bacterium]|nr:MAG: hypothetical protein E6R03_13355 [Hyphomicrobiaceae bacterium]
MGTALTYRIPDGMGRMRPGLHLVDTQDSPTPATLLSLEAQPYAFMEGDELLIAVDGGPTVAVVFDPHDFVDITEATAAEVALVLVTYLNVTAIEEDGHVRIVSNTTGLTSSLQIRGGRAQSVLVFGTGLAQGTQGQWSMVLGHEAPGEVWSLENGDHVTVRQIQDYDDALTVRLRGEVLFRGGPVGTRWTTGARTGGILEFIEDRGQDVAGWPRRMSLNDVVLNVASLGSTNLDLVLELSNTLGTPADIELPVVWFDWLNFETISGVFLGNRLPYPEQIAIPAANPSLRFSIVNTTLSPLDITTTEILINGQVAFQNGAFVAPFDGVLSTFVDPAGPAGRNIDFVVDLTGMAPLSSEQPVTILVNSQTLAGTTLADQYTYITADTMPPSLTSVVPIDLLHALVTFSEPVKMSGTGTALDPTAYTVTSASAPAVPLTVIAVETVGVSTVLITFDQAQTMGAHYVLQAEGVEDLQGNAVNAITVEWVGYRPPQPAGRRFRLWDFITNFHKAADITRDLRKVILCFQDISDHLLALIDEWPSVWDIDRAPEPLLDVILAELGNPFQFSMDLGTKRRLVGLLTTVYRQKGTAAGIINVVRFFLGLDISITPVNIRENFWLVGFNYLGVNTFVAPGKGDPAWYSFWIDSPVLLTDEQREQIFSIADYMKPAHEHILGIREPGGIITQTDYWRLGYGNLGVSTYIG